ncbi:MAG: MBL fold metallo-hydrolase, partial [Rhodothermales bacterium]|nr:MBL fold metallo-hydrolase [Rhodothermales bacterium]
AGTPLELDGTLFPAWTPPIFPWVAPGPEGVVVLRREGGALPAIDPATLRTRPERLRVTWLGHAAALIQTPTLNLLTDPMLGRRASPLPFAGPERLTPLPLALDDLPLLDVVLLSHDHYDHLDRGSIQAIQQRFAPLFLAPLGVGEIVRGWGATRVLELDWWQYVVADGVRYHCTPAKHFAGRTPGGRDATLWAGWMLEWADDLKLYFAGDSGYAPLFGDIRERLGAPDLALLPIGAYAPRWFMQAVHVDPAEAVQAARDLRARHVTPTHWGTCDRADEPLPEPPALFRRHAASAGLAGAVHVLDVGGTFTLPAEPTPSTPPPANGQDHTQNGQATTPAHTRPDDGSSG